MTLGSLFDGSGGFPLAAIMSGIKPIWSSEIEPYPLRVTATRLPDVKQLGDVTLIDGANVEPVDVISFGSPCQDLSIAGKQLGIHEGQRSNLFFEAIRIIKEMRNADKTSGRSGVDIRPRFAVWENVPGAFSSNKGADFTAVLEALAGVCEDGVSIPQPKKWRGAGCIVGDDWSIAWRVYDAQYWGVPQRRKRIYLVADFGSERAGEILFVEQGVSGHFAESGEAWKDVTADAEECSGRSVIAFKERAGKPGGGKGILPAVGRAFTLSTNVDQHICYALQGNGIDRADTAGCNGCGWRADKMYTLNTVDGPAVCYGVDCRNGTLDEERTHTLQAKSNGGISLNCTPSVIYDARGNGDGKTVPTLTGDHQNRVTDYTALCVQDMYYAQQRIGEHTNSNCSSCLMARCYKGATDLVLVPVPPRNYIVRRLTPLECCRLQGFPDWWEDGVDGSDSARYKMWGNGIALPCAYDVLNRIAQHIGDNHDANRSSR